MKSIRKDWRLIESLINNNSRVLDIGYGGGELIEQLEKNISAKTHGIELNSTLVLDAISKGYNVVHGNAEIDLKQYSDQSFDYVILSQTLQAFLNPELVLNELLRVGKKAIITIPNFGYWKVRLHLLLKGTMPITKTLPDEWYNTPNLHMCTIKDFVHFVKSRNIKIFKSIALNKLNASLINERNLEIKNLSADLGIFLIEK